MASCSYLDKFKLKDQGFCRKTATTKLTSKRLSQKSTTSPLTDIRGTPPLKGGESYNTIDQYFPLLVKGGVSCLKGHDGVVKIAFEIASFFSRSY
jgi:hypothetical protein